MEAEVERACIECVGEREKRSGDTEAYSSEWRLWSGRKIQAGGRLNQDPGYEGWNGKSVRGARL